MDKINAFFVDLYEKFTSLSWVQPAINYCKENTIFTIVIAALLFLILIVLCAMRKKSRKAKKQKNVEQEASEAPAEVVTEKVVEEIAEEVEEEADEEIAEEVEEEPDEEIAEEVEEEPDEEIAEEVEEEPTEESPTEEAIEEPAEEVVEETPAEEPIEEAIEETTEELVEETPEEEPIEEVVEETTEEVVEETPAEEPIEEVVEETTEEVVEEAPEEEPIEEVVEETVEEVVEEAPEEEPIEEVVEETVEEVVEETPAEEPIEEVVEETTEEVIEETPAEEPIEEVTEETVEEVVEEAPEEPADEAFFDEIFDQDFEEDPFIEEDFVEEFEETPMEERMTDDKEHSHAIDVDETIAMVEDMDESEDDFLRDHYDEDEIDRIARYKGKWVVCRVITNDEEYGEMYFFELHAGNGEKLLESEEFDSYQGALRGIQTHKANILKGNFRISLTKQGDFTFRLLSGKNMLLCLGANYPSMEHCQHAIDAATRFAATAILDENVQDIVIKVPLEDDTPIHRLPPYCVGKWIISSGWNAENKKVYYFDLYSDNGERLMESEEYTNYTGAVNGIRTHKKNIENNNFRITLTKKGDYVYKLVNANGQLLCLGEHYKTKRLCKNAVEAVRHFAMHSPMLTDENID